MNRLWTLYVLSALLLHLGVAGCSSAAAREGQAPGNDTAGDGGGGSGSDGAGPPSDVDGGAQACTVDPDAGACAACTAQMCCAEEQACQNDQACGILLRCLLACDGDQTCVSACGGAVPPAALDELTRALDCSNQNCSAACNPAPPAGCGAPPALHPSAPGHLYCDSALTCSTGQECCLGGATGINQYAPDTCNPLGAACTNGGSPDTGGSAGVPIACMQVSDCTGNGVAGAEACCLRGATAPAMQTSCLYPRSILGKDVVCETSECGADEVQLCTSASDCPSGKTCTPGKWKIYQLGFCL